ncbi:nucleoside triphosphate pyrophosphohydrolase [Halobacillus campisalis]|uniref:Phosphoribosyl-ATP pyrophosphohydrolase n=1 Tax=Halobacillus campisalis TaxID=435909 RepID=A0ABW2K1C9_9BACI|nr:nucleoside triphosphate pyrophosphohydrolase [Halobacillus campisalis]
MKKTYNKMVRDKIPTIIKENGQIGEYLQLDSNRYAIELRRKLNEEVGEYLETMDEIAATEELADILEVIHSLAKFHNKSFDEVENVRQQKFKERGGFEKGLLLVSTTNKMN